MNRGAIFKGQDLGVSFLRKTAAAAAANGQSVSIYFDHSSDVGADGSWSVRFVHAIDDGDAQYLDPREFKSAARSALIVFAQEDRGWCLSEANTGPENKWLAVSLTNRACAPT